MAYRLEFWFVKPPKAQRRAEWNSFCTDPSFIILKGTRMIYKLRLLLRGFVSMCCPSFGGANKVKEIKFVAY
jgi:hypothetical protein